MRFFEDQAAALKTSDTNGLVGQIFRPVIFYLGREDRLEGRIMKCSFHHRLEFDAPVFRAPRSGCIGRHRMRRAHAQHDKLA